MQHFLKTTSPFFGNLACTSVAMQLVDDPPLARPQRQEADASGNQMNMFYFEPANLGHLFDLFFS